MGIINFQGKRATSQQKTTELILVSDYMTTNLITFKANQSIEDVIESLIELYSHSGEPIQLTSEPPSHFLVFSSID